MATIVQSDNTPADVSSGTAATVFASNTALGHAVVLAIYTLSANTDDVASVSSSIGTFTRVNAKGGATLDCEMWVCLSSTGAGTTVTVTTTSGLAYDVNAFELSSAASSAYAGSAQSDSAATLTTSVTPHNVGDFLISLYVPAGSVTTYPSSPWTTYSGTGSWGSAGLGTSTQFAASTSTTTGTWAQNSTGEVEVSIGVAFATIKPRIPVSNVAVMRASFR